MAFLVVFNWFDSLLLFVGLFDVVRFFGFFKISDVVWGSMIFCYNISISVAIELHMA